MGHQPSDDEKNEPSLELPSLNLRRFGRSKRSTSRREPEAAQEPEAAREPQAPHEPGAAQEPEATAPFPTGTGTDTEPTARIPAGNEPAPQEPARHPTVGTRVDTRSETRTETPVESPMETRTPPDPGGTTTYAEPATPLSRPRRSRADGVSLPALPVRVAVVVTGLVVGALGTVLTYLAMAGCDAVRGTSSCGGGPGLLLLVATLAVMVLLGSLALKAWQVSDPGSTSFLAVAVVAVVVLVALLDLVFSLWIFVLVPIIGAASYALSHWVTTRFADESTKDSPHHDVR